MEKAIITGLPKKEAVLLDEKVKTTIIKNSIEVNCNTCNKEMFTDKKTIEAISDLEHVYMCYNCLFEFLVENKHRFDDEEFKSMFIDVSKPGNAEGVERMLDEVKKRF